MVLHHPGKVASARICEFESRPLRSLEASHNGSAAVSKAAVRKDF